MSEQKHIFDQLILNPIKLLFIGLGCSFLLVLFAYVNKSSPGIEVKETIVSANAYLNSSLQEKDQQKRNELLGKGAKLLESGGLNRYSASNLSRAFFFLITNQNEAAYQAVKKAEKLDNGKHNHVREINHFFPLVMSKYSVELSNKKKYDKAMMIAREGLKRNPKDPELYNVIGVFFYSKQQVDSALAYFSKAYNINPNHKPVKKNIFNLLMHQGNQALNNKDVQRANNMHSQALQLDPKNIALLILLAEENIQLKRFDKARAQINKVLSIKPDNKKAKELMRKLK